MLIVISILFLLFNLPSNVYFLGYAYGAFVQDTAEQQAVRLHVWAVVNILFCTNNSINFFMYFASGQKFRLAFLNTFFCVQPKKPGTAKTSSGTAMTDRSSEHIRDDDDPAVTQQSLATPLANAKILCKVVCHCLCHSVVIFSQLIYSQSILLLNLGLFFVTSRIITLGF